MDVMDIEEIKCRVTEICKRNEVQHLSLFGSFAKGTAGSRSDIDFVVRGCRNPEKLELDLEEIDTLRKIDIFYFDKIKNDYLRKDILEYEQKIY